MRTPTKKIALPLAVAATLAAGAGAGAAVAGGPGKGHTPAKHAVKHRAAHLLKAVTGYLDLTPQQLREQLRSGKSLAQVATAQGKSVDGLKKAIFDAAKARLDRAVANGRLKPDRELQLLGRLADRLDTLVNRTWPARGR